MKHLRRLGRGLAFLMAVLLFASGICYLVHNPRGPFAIGVYTVLVLALAYLFGVMTNMND